MASEIEVYRGSINTLSRRAMLGTVGSFVALGSVASARTMDDDTDDASDRKSKPRRNAADAHHGHAVRSAPATGITAFLTVEEIEGFLKRASSKALGLVNPGTEINDALSDVTYKLGAVRTASGDVLNAALAFSADTAPPAGAFYTEIGDFQVAAVGTADEKNANTHIYKAALGQNNKALITASWKVGYSAADSSRVNSGGKVYEVVVKCQKPFTEDRDCIIDCIKRHAPDCIWICQTLGLEACIACAGATAACCLINCHC
jgi:hypothetical protein